MTGKKKKDSDISFEDSLKKLEDIVEKLEKGELNLDQALKLYEEGMHFSDQCLDKLNQSKQKIEKISRNGENKYHTEPFAVQDNQGDENN